MKRDATGKPVNSGKSVNNWNSETKHRASVSLTSTAWRSLDKEAQKRGISRSDVIEHFAHSLEAEPSNVFYEADTQITLLQNQIFEQQQQIAALQRQKQELEAQLEKASDTIAQATQYKAATILESVTDAFVAFDRNWYYTYVNHTAAKILNKTPEELIGKHVWNEVFPDEVGSIAYRELHRAVAEQVPVAWEELGQPIGRWLDIHAYPSAEGMAVYFRDVTERKQAEAEREQLLQALETERTRFEAVLQQMPAGVLIADATSGKLVLANERAKHIIGYEASLEESSQPESSQPESSRPESSRPVENDGLVTSFEAFRLNGQVYAALESPLVRSLRTGETITNEEIELHRQDGNIIITVNSAPILDQQNQILASVAIFQDISERKSIEQALRESETRLRALFDANFIGLILADCYGNIREVNDSWLNTLGYTREEVLSGQVNFLEITPPEYLPLDIQGIAEMRQTGRHAPYEKEYIRKDGTRIPVLIGTVYLGSTEEVGIGFMIDLTERKRLESRLEQQEQQFRMLAENAPDIISRVDAEFRHLYISPSIEKMTGIPADRFIGKTHAELGISEEMDHIWHESLRQAFDSGQEQIIEFQFPTPEGVRYYQSRIVPEFACDGSVETVLGIARDVTDYKQIEQALRESEERLRLALTAAQLIVWDMDLQTNRVVCSANALEVWGVQAGSKEDFFAVIHPDDRQRVIQETKRVVMAGESSYFQEYRIINLDGTVRWLSSQGRIYQNDMGRGVRMVGVSIDVTERKQIEAERTQLLERERLARLDAETERKRLYSILMQFPAMIGIVKGPDLVYEFANPTYLQIAGRTSDIIGKPIRQVFPELEGQIYFDVLEQVYQTGETFIREESPTYWDRNGDGVLEEAFFNCIFPAWRDAEGNIQGVMIYNIEVTAQVKARQQIEQLLEELQQKERQQQFLIELNDAIRAIQDPKEIMWQVVCSTGQHFDVTRCTYGEIDSTQEYVIVDRDYCNGVVSIVGNHHMNSFGPEIIAELKQGKTIVVVDVDRDPRTAGSGAAAFDAIQTKSLLCVPLVKAGQFMALLVLHHAVPRQWTTEEVALMERIAEKTWLAVERSRAEEELRESEARLQLALKVGRTGTWDWDLQVGTLLWSEGHFTILGLQPSETEPSYEIWANRVHPDDLAETEAKLQQAIQEKTEYHHEYRLRWSDGSIHWVEARGQFSYDAQGHPKYSIGAVIDITERKQAEYEREQLLERERLARAEAETAQYQLKTIFETSPIGLALLDSEQRFIAINEALAEINGLTREQHLGTSIPELFGQSDPKLVEVFHQIYATGNPFISPNFAVNVPGRGDRRPGYYNVYYLPTVSANHQVESILVYVVDVTERVRLERAQQFLSETSAMLASSLDYPTTLEQIAQLTVPELADWCTVHIVAEDGAIDQIAVAHVDPAKLEWAHQIREKYPVDPNAARGVAFTLQTGRSDFIPEIPDELLIQAARDPEHLEILRQVGFNSVMTVPLQTQSQIIGVISLIFAESGRRYTLADLHLAEELARRASLAIDNAQLYQAAQRDRTKAETANRIKDEFLAILSHELRSPLNPILGWTRMLRSRQLNATTTEQALETIERNAKLQSQLIEDLLDISRILQGKMTLNVTTVNLAATIEAALETVRLAAEAKQIHIETVLNSIDGSVLGDTNRLQQVVWNLLSNAVKFTQVGGRVVIKLEQVGMYAQIQVKDTGKGIAPEFLPYVFDYFRQEDGTTTRRFGGLGLGLAIVRQLTELHGGTVWAESPGQNLGATFIVQLPLNIAEQEQSEQVEPFQAEADLTGVRVLVVDDDADMRELAAFVLTQAGAQVTTAASAMQALSLFNQSLFNRSLPDLLLCDIGMPEMNGYSLIWQIRKWAPEQGGNIPAIALTAYAGEINQQQALAAGFQMHISKPVEPERLVQAIIHLLHPVRGR